MKHERVDRRGAGDVQMIVAKIHAHRSAGGRHDLVELQHVPIAPEQRNAVGSVVDDGDESAVVLLDAPCVASDTALAVSGQCLKQDMAFGVVDPDLIGIRVVGHRHDERASMAAARVNSGAACSECKDRRRSHLTRFVWT